MSRIQVPVHFVCPRHNIWPDLAVLGAEDEIAPDRLADLCMSPAECWILQTYQNLRGYGPVSLGWEFRPNVINVVYVYDFGRKSRFHTGFVVTVQADAYPSSMGNFNIRQNGVEPASATQDWVPHWMQPGLVGRAVERGDQIEVMTFRGFNGNLHDAFRSPEFVQGLRERGIRLELGSGGRDLKSSWADYSGADVVVAIRNTTVSDIYSKPASKLVNAWAAGVPAILGPEPAFRELRRSDLDFIEAATPAEVLAALDRLRSEPGLYRAMVDNGLERALEFSREAVAATWVALFNGPVRSAFDRWQARPRALRALTVASMIAAEGQRKRRYLRERDHGPRLLDGLDMDIPAPVVDSRPGMPGVATQ